MAESLEPDLLAGHSKGYPLARKLNIPLIRVRFLIHDRVGGQRVLHFGYSGAQQLFDALTNALMAKKQADSSVGYSYMYDKSRGRRFSRRLLFLHIPPAMFRASTPS
jgi:nitrogenase molybdenum-iron protein NifN